MQDDQVMQFISECRTGKGRSQEEVLPIIYDELRALAASHLDRERDGHTLQPTALVHEAFVRLVSQARTTWKDKAHFSAVAAHVMRQVLIDHARKARAAKRGGGNVKVPLEMADAIRSKNPDLDLIELDEVLKRLENLNERHARVVELRFFAGMSVQETAEALGVSETTVKDDWQMARAWLQAQLTRA